VQLISHHISSIVTKSPNQPQYWSLLALINTVLSFGLYSIENLIIIYRLSKKKEKHGCELSAKYLHPFVQIPIDHQILPDNPIVKQHNMSAYETFTLSDVPWEERKNGLSSTIYFSTLHNTFHESRQTPTCCQLHKKSCTKQDNLFTDVDAMCMY